MSDRATPSVSFGEALRVWLRVAALSFGGPAGQIAVMQRILVDEKRWLSERRFLHALSYCMLLPGPEAQQLATYSGWLLHGWRGGLVAGTLFILPGFLSILALSVVYLTWGGLGAVQAVFYGMKPAVMAIVVVALTRIARRAFRGPEHVAIAACAFAAIFLLAIPYPAIVLAAGLTGLALGRWRGEPHALEEGASGGDCDPVDEPLEPATARPSRPGLRRAAATAALWLAIWWIPILALFAVLGPGHVLVREGVFFSKVAVVTFGGAYAVLAYVAQQAVEVYGWLAPGEMLDGLGLAETTPGPLIQVVQFVGFLGAWRGASGLSPLAAGIAGSVVTTWATFAPCFLFIFTGAPFIEWLRGNRALADALTGITAAVVGVILNLAVWFSMHALFARLTVRSWGPVHALVPDVATLDPVALAIAVAALVGLKRYRLGMLTVIAGSVAIGLLVWAVG